MVLLGAKVNEVRQDGIRLSLSAPPALHHRCHACYEPFEIAWVDARQDEGLVSATIVVGQSSEPDVLVVADGRVSRPEPQTPLERVDLGDLASERCPHGAARIPGSHRRDAEVRVVK
jgi:hypothetical protein